MAQTESAKKPPSRFKWLWENMKGFRGIYALGLVFTICYNIMQLTVPLVSGRIVDLFLTGENAAENLKLHRDLFFKLIFAMIGITLLRVVIVYTDHMIYEHVSQSVLYKIRNYLYDKIQRQDMTFYSHYRTGDIMTRVTGDLDAVRHMIAWVLRVIVESFSLFGAVAIYFFTVNVKMALSLLVIAPFVFMIIFRFRKSVAPMHAKLREKLAGMNTIAQENISGNRVVKAFTREDFEMEKFDKSNTDYRDTNKATAMVWIRYYPFVESFANLMPLTMLFVGGGFLISGELTMVRTSAINGSLAMMSSEQVQ